MSYQAPIVFNDTIVSGASTSSGVNLTRSWEKIYVAIPSMSTSALINIQVSVDSGTTYFPLQGIVPNTSSVQANGIAIASSVGAGSGLIEIPGGSGAPYIRFVATGVVSGGVILKVLCSGS